MTVESINFNQNLKTYAINGDESNVVKINTADYVIFDRADKAKAILAELSNRANNATTDNAFTELSEIDKEVKEQLNYVFGTDVSTPAFGTANCLSPVNGEPMFLGFFNALLQIISHDIESATKKMAEGVKKYTHQLPKA